jgi:dTDP-4-amino-4,6-dideoxygalactose transaminase
LILFANRASAILYNILAGRRDDRPFILPANVCPIVPLTFLKAGRKFEFVDIRHDSYCLDDEVVLEKVQKEPTGYSGILFVRTYGIGANPDTFFKKIKELNADLLVIDDKCLCVPEIRNTKESSADLELFSTGYSKHVDLGWGGFGYVDEGFAYETHYAAYDKRALDSQTAQIETALRARRAFEYKETDWLDMGTPEIVLQEYLAKIVSALPVVRQQRERVNAIYRRNLPQEIAFVDDGHT